MDICITNPVLVDMCCCQPKHDRPVDYKLNTFKEDARFGMRFNNDETLHMILALIRIFSSGLMYCGSLGHYNHPQAATSCAFPISFMYLSTVI